MADQLKRMTFGEHLEELRIRVIRSLLALGLTFAACLIFQDDLFRIVSAPHTWAVDALKAEGRFSGSEQLVQFSYPDTFFTYMKLVIICALFFASPIVIWQMWGFIAAGLYPNEKRHIGVIGPMSFLLFVGGCLFGYFVVIPSGLYYLAGYSADVTLMISISDYLSLVMMLTIIMGSVFEMPLLMFFFSKIGLVHPSSYGKWRKFAIVAIFIVAAIITPTGDPVTQCLVAGPMIVLYEVGILLARVSAPKVRS